MNNFELDYKDGEERIELMTRTPWLRDMRTGEIVYSREGYPIGDNVLDPRWKTYPISLHYNNGVMTSEPELSGPTEFYVSDGEYAIYKPMPNDIYFETNAIEYSLLLRERYERYLKTLFAKNKIAYTIRLNELLVTWKEMKKELQKEKTEYNKMAILVEREDAANDRNARAAARAGARGGSVVARRERSVREARFSKLAKISKLEKTLSYVESRVNQLKINIYGIQ